MNDLNVTPAPHALRGVPTNGATPRSGGASAEQCLSYWREKLAGIPAILELPTDRPRPPAQSFRAAQESMLLPGELKRSLEALANRECVSLSVVLLAAFQTLLARYTRQDDIVSGFAIARETDIPPEANPERNTVAIRSDLSDDPAFRQFLSRVNDAVNGARDAGNVPWDRLVEAAQPDRDASRHPIFQAAFSLEDAQAHSDRKVTNFAEDGFTLKVDLELQLQDAPDGFAARFTYATDLFDATTIVRMAGHFRKLLEGIVANPEEPVSTLPLLTQAERHQLVVEWNATAMDYARDRAVHQLFEAQVARTPNAVAVVFGDQSLTYGELDRRANQLARHLIQLGARPDGLVGICLERSLEMVVGLLGILKAGSAYVPLDPAYPRDRIAFMLENAEAPLLVTQQSLKESLPATQAKLVLIDSDWPEIASQSGQSPALALDPKSRAYVIYTSGSTGKPKGVEIPHRAVVNFLTTMADCPGMESSDRLLAVTTLCFDIAGLEVYLPLTQGASLEIVSREVAADGNRLAAKLKTASTTVMQATPATWRMLLEAGWTGDPRLKILIGGEAVSQKLASQLIEKSASAWNVYGPTETTIWSTLSQLHADCPVTIGRPIGNTEIFILDKKLQPVPIGVAGELHIGGDGLARGYLKRPELTAEKFIQHPLNSDPEARLYKTGDLVRYLANGNIEFLGRIDHQVKIRGFRIELGEIEAVLRQHPGINETVVVAREDTPGEKQVVAYFVPAGAAAPSVSELRAFLREKLPEYMLPAVFVTLKSMPLTPNGKVNRQALPAPDQADLAPKGEFAAARDDVESGLVRIWESVLGVRSVGIHDNFFELGGHSIVAVRLMNRIEETFGKILPIATLLQAPTVEQLAAIVRQNGAKPDWSCMVAIQTGGSKTPFFCVHGANGAVVRFHSLSRYLGSDQPFYGLQAQGLDASLPCHTSFEEMASHYIDEIRKIQPHGPYFLGGYSLGGTIAFEMAQQLAAQGEPHATVVLFDTNLPQRNGSAPQQEGSATSVLRALFRIPAAERSAYVSRMMGAPSRFIQRRLHLARLPGIVKKVRKACLQAEQDYRPRPYAGRVILFRSDHEPLGRTTDPRAGWKSLAKQGLEIREIAGNHENILLEPQVRFVAERLKGCLNQGQVKDLRANDAQVNAVQVNVPHSDQAQAGRRIPQVASSLERAV
jgi:amino acid adenylation domain-containing protein